MSATISDEGYARLAAVLAERSRRSPKVAAEPGVLALADRAAQPTLSISDEVVCRQVEAIEAPEDVDLPGDLAAATRLARASLALRLRRECNMSAWGAEAAAWRITARGLLELDGHADLRLIANACRTSPATLKRDAALLRRVHGDEVLAALGEAA